MLGPQWVIHICIYIYVVFVEAAHMVMYHIDGAILYTGIYDMVIYTESVTWLQLGCTQM